MKGDIMAIDFVYEDELKLSKDNYEQQFIKIVEAALQYLKIEDDVELSCIIVPSVKRRDAPTLNDE